MFNDGIEYREQINIFNPRLNSHICCEGSGQGGDSGTGFGASDSSNGSMANKGGGTNSGPMGGLKGMEGAQWNSPGDFSVPSGSGISFSGGGDSLGASFARVGMNPTMGRPSWGQGGWGSTPSAQAAPSGGLPGGWMTPSQVSAYNNQSNAGLGSRGSVFGASPFSTPTASRAFSGFDSTPFSAMGSNSQSNPFAQAFSGKVGGEISGPANPYNNGQFVQKAQPSSVFDALQSAWNNVFSTMGVQGKVGGFGIVPGGKTGNQAAPGQPATNPLAFQQSNPGSFQQHPGQVSYGTNAQGQSVPMNGIASQGFLSADAGRGESPGALLAAAIGSLTPGQALSPGVLNALQSASPNVITFAMDHADENTVLALMREAVNTNTPIALTNYRYQQMPLATVIRILNNPALSNTFRAPYVDATKGVLDKAANFITRQANLAFRLSTKPVETIQIRLNPNEPWGYRAALMTELSLRGYTSAQKQTPDGNPQDYGQAPTIANSVLYTLQQSANGSTIIGQGTTIQAVDGKGQAIGVTITSDGNNQYTISLPGPLYGPLGVSAQTYAQYQESAKGFMGESGNPWSGNSQNIQMWGNAVRIGHTEIGPVVKADGSFTLGQRLQTIPGTNMPTGESYNMPTTQTDNFSLVEKSPTIPIIPPETQGQYAQTITTAGWPDAMKQYFNQLSTYNQIVQIWQQKSPDTSFPEWAQSFDWQGYYNANYKTPAPAPSSGGSNMYRPTSRSGNTRRLRSVSY